MAQAQQLQRLNQKGWRVGFGNLLRKESSEWWGTRTWLVHAAIWLAILNGLLAAILWRVPAEASDLPANAAAAIPGGGGVFLGVGGLATAIGIIIVAQGAIMDEKKSGTLEWVLSKPVARPAVILAKLLANAFSAIVIMVVLQGAVAYVQFALKGTPPDALLYLGGLGLLALHILFYLTLTLTLGVLLKNRGAVLGLCIAFLFSYQFVGGLAPAIVPYMPWGLMLPASPEIQGLAPMLATGQALPTLTPIYATVVWIIVMVGVAIWRFDKTEF